MKHSNNQEDDFSLCPRFEHTFTILGKKAPPN